MIVGFAAIGVEVLLAALAGAVAFGSLRQQVKDLCDALGGVKEDLKVERQAREALQADHEWLKGQHEILTQQGIHQGHKGEP